MTMGVDRSGGKAISWHSLHELSELLQWLPVYHDDSTIAICIINVFYYYRHRYLHSSE